jgi:hypothetical protein
VDRDGALAWLVCAAAGSIHANCPGRCRPGETTVTIGRTVRLGPWSVDTERAAAADRDRTDPGARGADGRFLRPVLGRSIRPGGRRRSAPRHPGGRHIRGKRSSARVSERPKSTGDLRDHVFTRHYDVSPRRPKAEHPTQAAARSGGHLSRSGYPARPTTRGEMPDLIAQLCSKNMPETAEGAPAVVARFLQPEGDTDYSKLNRCERWNSRSCRR